MFMCQPVPAASAFMDQDLSLRGRRALVVGGGRGIGRAITLALATDGASVAVADLERDRAESVAAEVTALGGKTTSLTGDVRSTRDLDAFVSGTVSHLGGLDVLVTVVGGQNAFAPFQPLHEYTDEQWELVLDVN